MKRRNLLITAFASPVALSGCWEEVRSEDLEAAAPNLSESTSSAPPVPAPAPASGTAAPAPPPIQTPPAPPPAQSPPSAPPPPSPSLPQGNLPSWVPSRLGEAGLVPMTNSLRDVVVLNETLLRNQSTFVYGAYSGGAYNPYYGPLGAHVIHGGGHSATQDNSVFIADYNTLRFERVGEPTLLPTYQDYEDRIRFGGFADDNSNPREVEAGVPGSAHTYDCLLILPPAVGGDAYGSLIRPVAGAVGYGVSRTTGRSHSFGLSSRKWKRASTNASAGWTPGGSCAYDSRRQRIWPLMADNSSALSYLDLNTGTWSNAQGAPQSVSGYPDMVYSAYCAHRDVVVLSTNREADTAAKFYWFSAGSNGQARTPVSFSSGALPPGHWGRASLVYVPELNKLIWFSLYGGDNYYEIDIPANPAEPWSWIARPISGPARPSQLSPAPYNSIYKRMDYSPQLKSLMWVTGQSTASSYDFGGRVVAIRVAP